MATLHIHHAPSIHVSSRVRDFSHGLWRLADPKIALASLVPFAVGTVLAFDQHMFVIWPLFFAAYAAVFLVEVGKNAVNDIYDFRSGADTAVRPEERSPFSGGKRTLVDHLMTENDLVVVAWIAFGIAGIIGVEVALRSSLQLLLLGAAAAAISVVYVMPPLKLSYRGLGELAVGLVYGPGIVIGALLLQGATITSEVLIASTSIGILIATVLIANEIPDERADRFAGKKNLVVRIGRHRTELLIPVLFATAIAFPPFMAAYGHGPLRLLAFIAGVPPALLACATLDDEGRPPVAAQGLTLATYAITGAAYVFCVLLLPPVPR